MNKKVILSIVLLMIISFYFIFKPFIIHDFGVYFKNERIADYTLYVEIHSKAGDTVIEPIYDDGDHVYYFGVPKSHHYRLVKGTETLTLQEALELGAVTIDELVEAIDELQVMDHEEFE